MAGKEADIDKLFELQELDQQIEDAQKQLKDSPYSAKIEAVRNKKNQIKEKRDSIDKVFVQTRDELNMITAKDSELAHAQQKVQVEIEQTQGDYRKVEAHTNKLNEITNHRKQIDEKLAKIEANFNKIKQLKAQVDGAIEKLSMQEDDYNLQMQKELGDVKLELDELTAEKHEIESEISPDVLELYKKVKARSGRIVVAELDAVTATCKVCRNKISNSGIAKIRKEAPVSICPNCRRLIVVR